MNLPVTVLAVDKEADGDDQDQWDGDDDDLDQFECGGVKRLLHGERRREEALEIVDFFQGMQTDGGDRSEGDENEEDW